MSIFSSLFNESKTTKTNSEIMEETLQELESLTNDCLKAADVNMLDLFTGLDEESGALLGRCIQSYKKIMRLAVEQAEVIDRMEKKIDGLAAMNETLLKKLNDLSDQVKKVGKEK